MLKKVQLKHKVDLSATEQVDVKYIPCLMMEAGEKYLNMMCNCVLQLRTIEECELPHTTGIERMRYTRLICDVWAHTGEKVEATMWGTIPVITNQPEMIAKVMVAHEKCCGIINARVGARLPKERKMIVGEDGKPVERKKRQDADPVTGCAPGTQGHVLGLIMIQNKCSPSTRCKIIPLMQQCLVKDFGFEEVKAKGLASSWYSTNWIRKPEFYQKTWK